MKRLAPLLIFAALSIGADAELKWDETKLELAPKLSDMKVDARFTFENAGAEPVRIEAVQPQCGCTTAALKKHIYKPGEKGEIDATFTIGDRVGVQTKQLSVRIKDRPEPVVLTMVIKIPQSAQITPQYIYWAADEKLVPKTIVVKAPPDSALRVTGVTSVDPRFKTTIETVEENKEYRIVVTPDGPRNMNMARLAIQAEIPPDQQKIFHAYAQLRPAPPQ
ncbi:MAG: DUF1573 domain-containing protein [Verrucomicrobiota bacterium]|nr:DUF1573 domain-containing protein [Verrucomicrobiota bacterium]